MQVEAQEPPASDDLPAAAPEAPAARESVAAETVGYQGGAQMVEADLLDQLAVLGIAQFADCLITKAGVLSCDDLLKVSPEQLKVIDVGSVF